jgi:polyribonucleotide nucleotidyltransferase
MKLHYKIQNKDITVQVDKNRENSMNINFSTNNISIFGSLVLNKNNINKKPGTNLTIFYKETPYSTGKFNKKTFNKSDKEIRISRQIDRTLRPLLENFNEEMNITIMMLENINNEDPLNDILLTVFILMYVSGFKNILNNIYGEHISGKEIRNFMGDGINKNYNLLATVNDKGIIMLEGYLNKLTEGEVGTLINTLMDKKNIYKDLYSYIDDNLSENFSINEGSSLLSPVEIPPYKKRLDGRKWLEIRPIHVKLNPLKLTSCIFQRGDTEVLVVANISEGDYNDFNLQYKFHPFSVGETGETFGNSRREKGHSFLAQNSFKYIAYRGITYDIISEVLKCNGSSSMATVCGGSICLHMLFGDDLISGITTGIINNNLLVDLRSEEDYISECDLKLVSNKNEEIFSLFMDTKKPISLDNFQKLMEKALKSNIKIIKSMEEIININKTDFKTSILIKKEKIPYINHKNNLQNLENLFESKIKCFTNGLIVITGNNKKNFQVLKEVIESYDSLLHDKKITCLIHSIKENTEKQTVVHLGSFNYIPTEDFKYKVGDVISGTIDNNHNKSNKIILHNIKKIMSLKKTEEINK